MKYLTKTHRIKAYPTNKDDWSYVRDLFYWGYRVANLSATETYIGIKAGLDKKELSRKVYDIAVRQLCANNPEMKSLTASSTWNGIRNDVFKKLTAVEFRKELMSGNVSLPTYKRSNPIPILAIKPDKSHPLGSYLYKLISTPGDDFEIYGGRKISLSLGTDFVARSILKKLREGEYIICDSKIQLKNKELYLLLSYKIPVKETCLDENKFLGVDIGLNTPAYCAVLDKYDRCQIGGREEFIHKRTRISGSRRRLQKALKHNTGGNGRSNKLKKLEILKEKEKNFAKTMNHSYSKKVVEFALKNDCGTIVLEDLKGIGDNINDYVLGNWGYFQLQSMIEYKAKEHNISVIKVAPKDTSKTCSRCGHVSQDNRTKKDGWEKFKCVSCGYETNADYNAAINVATKGKELINKQAVSLEKKQIKKVS